jgi:two-component system, LuxR family, sensor kinase FixL
MTELVPLVADVIQQLPIGLVVWQVQGHDLNSFTLIEVNQVARQILGLSEPFNLEDAVDPFPGFLKIETPQAYAEVLRHERVKDLGVVRYRNASGLEQTLALKVFPLEHQRVGLMVDDISDRQRAESLLHQSEQRLVIYVQQTPLAFIEWNLNGEVVEWNPAAEEMFGYSKREALGKQAADLMVAAEHVNHMQQIWASLLQRRGGRRNTQSNVTRSGRTIFCEWYNTPLVNEDGDVIGVISLAEDVTERHRAEAALIAFTSQLEQSNRELEDFASVASHDLQEPLRKILTFGDRLQATCGEKLTDEGHDYLRRMLNAAQRMQVLIDDLLTLARVTTKGQSFRQVNLSTILSGVLSDLEVRIQQVNGQITADPLPTIEADPLQMRQLLQNLVSNSLKFHGESPPHIQIKSSTFVGTNAQPQCQITITDNGIGFDDIYRDRIFTMFQRLHSRHTYEGTGVGLAICRKIVQRHGGHITATSKPGQGATFVITLPICQNGGIGCT